MSKEQWRLLNYWNQWKRSISTRLSISRIALDWSRNTEPTHIKVEVESRKESMGKRDNFRSKCSGCKLKRIIKESCRNTLNLRTNTMRLWNQNLKLSFNWLNVNRKSYKSVKVWLKYKSKTRNCWKNCKTKTTKMERKC